MVREEFSAGRLQTCSACPRLVALRNEVRAAHPEYHAAPVIPWGSKSARLLIVGLAPGMHGANRTGRPFTGDASGRFLFAALFEAGFVTAPHAEAARLINTRITNAVKCLPPGNRPIAAEIQRCRPYLAAELGTLLGERPRKPRVVLCLGRMAHDAVVRALPVALTDARPIATQPFAHGRSVEVARNVYLIDSYHPSRQNTQTGRLTRTMLRAVLSRIRRILDLP